MVAKFLIIALMVALNDYVTVAATVGSRSKLMMKEIQLGPRPYFLVNEMSDSPLQKTLSSCQEVKMRASKWSIGHRGGGTLQFPEHSLQSNLAGARMGAGILECDVTFTKDRQLVCRHSQCDLHTTTNIVTLPELNAQCSKPFSPAAEGKPASARCCTSDITLAEFKTLCAKMDGFNASATNPDDYIKGTPSWRTDLYDRCGTVLEHREHIALVEKLGLEHTAELKEAMVSMPFEGNYSQDMVSRQLIGNYRKAGVSPSRVMLQSFAYDDLLSWLEWAPDFAKRAVLLDQDSFRDEPEGDAAERLTKYARAGIRTIAPQLDVLVDARNGSIEPSAYAKKAKELGLELISWTLERLGPQSPGRNQSGQDISWADRLAAVDGDVYTLIDALYRQVRVVGLFSDWSATTTFYANCFNIDERGQWGASYQL